MWSELLPKLVGGTLTDHDCPDEPTKVVGYELDDKRVVITGEDFTWGGKRDCFFLRGLTATTVELIGPAGMSASVTFPTPLETP